MQLGAKGAGIRAGGPGTAAAQTFLDGAETGGPGWSSIGGGRQHSRRNCAPCTLAWREQGRFQ